MNTSEEIIGKPIKVENIEIAQHDFPNAMNWDAACAVCNLLGVGWRLPTRLELHLLYKNKDKIGGFVHNLYWSSSAATNDYDFEEAWAQNFTTKFQSTYLKDGNFHVRAVRTL